jgi:hypothetical protein
MNDKGTGMAYTALYIAQKMNDRLLESGEITQQEYDNNILNLKLLPLGKPNCPHIHEVV